MARLTKEQAKTLLREIEHTTIDIFDDDIFMYDIGIADYSGPDGWFRAVKDIKKILMFPRSVCLGNLYNKELIVKDEDPRNGCGLIRTMTTAEFEQRASRYSLHGLNVTVKRVLKTRTEEVTRPWTLPEFIGQYEVFRWLRPEHFYEDEIDNFLEKEGKDIIENSTNNATLELCNPRQRSFINGSYDLHWNQVEEKETEGTGEV